VGHNTYRRIGINVDAKSRRTPWCIRYGKVAGFISPSKISSLEKVISPSGIARVKAHVAQASSSLASALLIYGAYCSAFCRAVAKAFLTWGARRKRSHIETLAGTLRSSCIMSYEGGSVSGGGWLSPDWAGRAREILWQTGVARIIFDIVPSRSSSCASQLGKRPRLYSLLESGSRSEM